MHHPLISKQPDNIILQVNTNDSAVHDSEAMVKDLLNLEGFIKKKLSNCKIVLSRPILRANSNKTIKK